MKKINRYTVINIASFVILFLAIAFFYKECTAQKHTASANLRMLPDISDKTKVTITTYQTTKEQCDNNPFVTASGYVIHGGEYLIAVSRDLLKKGFGYGQVVRFKTGHTNIDSKYYVVVDCMNKRFNNRVDILSNTNFIIHQAEIYTVNK